MTHDEAIEILRYHSFTHEDIDNPKSENGFLGMLRPFQGTLFGGNFHELMTVLKTLKECFFRDHIDRQIVSKFWSICHFSRAWGVEEGSMLRAHNLISAAQIDLLRNFIDCISYTIMNLLEGVPDDEAFVLYTVYLEGKLNGN